MRSEESEAASCHAGGQEGEGAGIVRRGEEGDLLGALAATGGRLAVRDCPGPSPECGGVVRTRPAGCLTPLWLVGARGTRDTGS